MVPSRKHAVLRWLKWIVGILLAPVVLAVLFIAVFGWNWLRAPIERVTLEKTGRVLLIGGDIEVELAWPLPRVHSGPVSFANPAWATEKQMVSAAAAAVSIDLPQLLQRNLVFPEVRLQRPVIFLEQTSDGRKNWLLDRKQQDESARIRIDRLMLDQGTLGYDDVARKTRIRATLSTADTQPGKAELAFTAQGQYKGSSVQGARQRRAGAGSARRNNTVSDQNRYQHRPHRGEGRRQRHQPA